jgi:hypothetical protein
VARKKPYQVFVSYSRHDEGLVKPLAGLLGAVAATVFLDVESIKPGDVWQTAVENAVRESSVFIVCWCCESGRSQFIQREIAVAMEDKRKRLVPVLLCSMPLPSPLGDLQWIDIQERVIHQCDLKVHAEQLPPSRLRRLRAGTKTLFGWMMMMFGWMFGWMMILVMSSRVHTEEDAIAARAIHYFESLGKKVADDTGDE